MFLTRYLLSSLWKFLKKRFSSFVFVQVLQSKDNEVNFSCPYVRGATLLGPLIASVMNWTPARPCMLLDQSPMQKKNSAGKTTWTLVLSRNFAGRLDRRGEIVDGREASVRLTQIETCARQRSATRLTPTQETTTNWPFIVGWRAVTHRCRPRRTAAPSRRKQSLRFRLQGCCLVVFVVKVTRFWVSAAIFHTLSSFHFL